MWIVLSCKLLRKGGCGDKDLQELDRIARGDAAEFVHTRFGFDTIIHETGRHFFSGPHRRVGDLQSPLTPNYFLPMHILEENVTVSGLKAMAEATFGNLVKAVVDVKRRIIAVDAELHSDQEALLLGNGSKQEDLWGINLYPEFGVRNEDFIEFDSMINLRPAQGNRSRGIDDAGIRALITEIVRVWVQ